ncbi:MAG: acyl-CoA thioesterase [Bacteroidales bacterium]|nr:acyl-CoA thioesterase [Bacteroidales bacterium]
MIVVPDKTLWHKTDVQIRFNDIDIAAHVNNAVYQNYFDLAKTHFFDAIFGEVIDWKIKGLVLVHIEIDYYQPTYLEEQIEVESTMTKIGKKSFDMVQVVRKKGTKGEESIKCVSRSVMVGYHYRDAYSFDLPDAWIEKIKQYDHTI